jgi:prepilin-type processing-associated H-X9-DG protein
MPSGEDDQPDKQEGMGEMMKGRRKISGPDVAVVMLCLVFFLLTVGAAGRQGRRRAREAICVSNLGQWGGIFRGYVQRNDGRFFTGQGSRGYWWPEELRREHKNRKQMKIWFCPEADEPMIDENGEVGGAGPVFTAWGIYQGDDLGAHGLAGSYGLNGYTVDISEWGTYEGGVSAEDGWRNFKTVADADRVPLFIDALRFDMWPQHFEGPAANEFSAWTANSMARCCINRHAGAVGCLFLDGSARKVGLKALWTMKWHRTFNTEGPWTVAGGVWASDWPEWMRGFKDY